MTKALGVTAVLCATLGVSMPAMAERPNDGLIFDYHKALEGKKVAFVPITMGFDLTQGWMAAVERDAERLGYELTIRDPNWNVDAGAQAIEQLINEKPDVLIVHNNDMQAYAKLIRRAMDAGINVIQMNLKTPVNSDAFVGGDWYDVGVKTAQEAARMCGKGTSGKVAVVQGPVTAPPNQLGVAGVEDALSEYPDIEIVSNQAADWDASKARSIASTILKQHGDLCAFIGLWDNMDVGIAAAIREAGLTEQVKLISTGGGNQQFGCTNLESGAFASYVKVDTRDQANQLAETIQILLQTRPEPGSQPFGLYTENKILTPDTVGPASCWTLDGIKAGD
ncbi:sugar ABC transporter substrate-binding protein [uncultured Sulfitobacter sp.]|uniref:sugar ABC transporter substrate-binding protein n=1 Tax=uncultured Sulfitobacter sp. TaxID=191468 RepID=UPI0025941166|nr:sugar ABC transporter substrate-binding protein [uncultured Sulfitobacter sp.]